MVKEDLTCSFSILPVSQAFFVHRSFSPSAFLYKKTLRPKKEKKLNAEPPKLRSTEALCNDLSPKKLRLLKALFSDVLSLKNSDYEKKTLKTVAKKLSLPERWAFRPLPKIAQKKSVLTAVTVSSHSELCTKLLKSFGAKVKNGDCPKQQKVMMECDGAEFYTSF